MFELSYKMIRKRSDYVKLVMLVLVGAVTAGCASQHRPGKVGNLPLYFNSERGLPRVIVYGSLGELLPSFDATPAIERFLYGPDDIGKAMLRNPQGMALLGGQLLVCDQGQTDVMAIDLQTGRCDPWGDSEHRPRCPVDITVDADGRVYVADTTLRSILVYDAGRHFLEELSPTNDPKRKFRPCGLCVRDGVLYVGNSGDRQIDRWDIADRRWLPPLVPPKNMRGLIAPTGICTTPEGTLLVADALQGTVFRIDPSGQWLKPIGQPGRGLGEFIRPKQVCCGPSGLIFVTDAGRQSVLVFRSAGQYLMEIHERKDRWNGWTLPMGLIALELSDLPLLELPAENGRLPQVDEYVIVSDSLGGISLTLLGVTTKPKGAER